MAGGTVMVNDRLSMFYVPKICWVLYERRAHHGPQDDLVSSASSREDEHTRQTWKANASISIVAKIQRPSSFSEARFQMPWANKDGVIEKRAQIWERASVKI